MGRAASGGVGTLTVTNDAKVFVGDAAKTGANFDDRLNVSDSDADGNSGGNLSIYNGSTLTHGGNAIVGDDANEFGWATVSGTGSMWTATGSSPSGLLTSNEG